MHNTNISHTSNQFGFSLIELLVVIMIIAILGSIAAPVYKDYLIKAKVIELFALAQPAKLAVTEALISETPAAHVNNDKLGLEKAINIGRVKEITIDNAIITVVGDPQALGIPDNKDFSIILTPQAKSGTIQWTCVASPVDFKKYAPADCR